MEPQRTKWGHLDPTPRCWLCGRLIKDLLVASMEESRRNSDGGAEASWGTEQVIVSCYSLESMCFYYGKIRLRIMSTGKASERKKTREPGMNGTLNIRAYGRVITSYQKQNARCCLIFCQTQFDSLGQGIICIIRHFSDYVRTLY